MTRFILLFLGFLSLVSSHTSSSSCEHTHSADNGTDTVCVAPGSSCELGRTGQTGVCGRRNGKCGCIRPQNPQPGDECEGCVGLGLLCGECPDGESNFGWCGGCVVDDTGACVADVLECPPGDECPPQEEVLGAPCSLGTECRYGEETCCGVTHDSFVCNCFANGVDGHEFACFYTDACLDPSCGTEEPECTDCVLSRAPQIQCPNGIDFEGPTGVCEVDDSGACVEIWSTCPCNGFAGWVCPEGQMCVDIPGDGCDEPFGSDCIGECVWPDCSGIPDDWIIVATPDICPLIDFICDDPAAPVGWFDTDCGCGCRPEGVCCDPALEPGQNGNPFCFEGHACCLTGEWQCSIGDGVTFPCGATHDCGTTGDCPPEEGWTTVNDDPDRCATIRFTCDGGDAWFDDVCGCGCTGSAVCDLGPSYRSISTDPESQPCKAQEFLCPNRWEPFFDEQCGCGCKRVDMVGSSVGAADIGNDDQKEGRDISG